MGRTQPSLGIVCSPIRLMRPGAAPNQRADAPNWHSNWPAAPGSIHRGLGWLPSWQECHWHIGVRRRSWAVTVTANPRFRAQRTPEHHPPRGPICVNCIGFKTTCGSQTTRRSPARRLPTACSVSISCQNRGLGAPDRPWPAAGSFLRESLQALKSDLQEMGQGRMVLEGSPELVLPNLVDRFGTDRISTSDTPGWYEEKAIRFLEKLPGLLKIFRGPALFDSEQFPFSLDELPHTFSPFRRKVEQLTIPGPVAKPAALPAPPSRNLMRFHAPPTPTPVCLPAAAQVDLRRLVSFCFRLTPLPTTNKPATTSMAWQAQLCPLAGERCTVCTRRGASDFSLRARARRQRVDLLALL